jgi:hypothetical protein
MTLPAHTALTVLGLGMGFLRGYYRPQAVAIVSLPSRLFFEIVTDAVAVLVGSAAAVALMVTPAGAGTEFGALYSPGWAIAASPFEWRVERNGVRSGMPVGPPSHMPAPKSAWNPRLAPIVLTMLVEFGSTGNVSTGVFQMFVCTDRRSTLRTAWKCKCPVRR